MDVLYLVPLAVFLFGWLIKHFKAWGEYVAIAGASLYVLVYVLRMFKLI